MVLILVAILPKLLIMELLIGLLIFRKVKFAIVREIVLRPITLLFLKIYRTPLSQKLKNLASLKKLSTKKLKRKKNKNRKKFKKLESKANFQKKSKKRKNYQNSLSLTARNTKLRVGLNVINAMPGES